MEWRLRENSQFIRFLFFLSMAVHPKSEETVIRIHDDDEEPKPNSMAPTNFKHKFKQFDVITGKHSRDHRSNFLALTPSHDLIRNPKADYYYIPRYHQPELSPETISLIMKEREILNDNLPDSIFVRAYEKRIDLLRAVIIGPPGTPYHGGLFFFDICISCGYPNTHPIIFLRRRRDLLLNPNLNPNPDKVISYKTCTEKEKKEKVLDILLRQQSSLISSAPEPYYLLLHPSRVVTCAGKEKKHNMLDILLWLQSNLISSAPPALDHSYLLPTFWGYLMEREHLTFDQEIFMQNCKTMLATLYHPPYHFKEFVVQHFRDHAESILNSCIPYIDDNISKVDQGVTVAIEEELQGYKKSMKEIYVKLVKEFIKNGSPESLMTDYNVGGIVSDAINDEKKRKVAELKSYCLSLLYWSVGMPIVLMLVIFGSPYVFAPH